MSTARVSTDAVEQKTRRPQLGPPLLAPVVAFAVVTVIGVVVNRSTPHPDATGAAVLAYDSAHATAAKVGSWLLFSAAIPLAIATGVIYRRLRALGISAPGAAIALIGGISASSALIASATFGWTGAGLAMEPSATPALARALAGASYVTGGPAYAVMFGLLVAGIAVPMLLTRLLPRTLAITGLVIAAVGMVSSLAMLSVSFGFLLPVVRFGGLIWLVVTACVLPRSRRN